MPKQNETDVFEVVTRFQRKILSKKPSTKQMFNDVRMMNFKIKPMYGDISVLNLHNLQFIEALWSLGKLDDFYQKNIERVQKDQKDMFMRLINEMRQKYQLDLNKSNIKPEKVKDSSPLFEMEIFKERGTRIN